MLQTGALQNAERISIVRLELPAHLRRLAGTGLEVRLPIPGPVTQRAVLDVLEDTYPALKGTLRDQTTKLRRPFIRFFGCQEDLSHLAPDELLPQAIALGLEPLLVIGAIAGG